MKAVNVGLIMAIIAIAYFATDNLRLGRIQNILFDRALININMDVLITDVFCEAVTGIDEFGEAVISKEKAAAEYKRMMKNSVKVSAEDWTAFAIFTGRGEIDEELFEHSAASQIKTVNKRLNYSFLFTENTTSYLYNPICENSIYIMYLPRLSNLIRLKSGDIMYTLSGAKIR